MYIYIHILYLTLKNSYRTNSLPNPYPTLPNPGLGNTSASGLPNLAPPTLSNHCFFKVFDCLLATLIPTPPNQKHALAMNELGCGAWGLEREWEKHSRKPFVLIKWWVHASHFHFACSKNLNFLIKWSRTLGDKDSWDHVPHGHHGSHRGSWDPWVPWPTQESLSPESMIIESLTFEYRHFFKLRASPQKGTSYPKSITSCWRQRFTLPLPSGKIVLEESVCWTN